ncbi:MAG: hypothetical protein U0840_25650 [Gemmataceae bacterium]
MPELARVRQSVVIGGTTYEHVTDVEGLSMERATPSIPAAKSGTLTTRTDNDTGVVTLGSGHGISTGHKVSVFWSGGKRFGMTATVSGNAVTLDGGTGDNLPVLNTAVTAAVPVEVPYVVDTEQLRAMAAHCTQPGYIEVLDGAGTPARIALLSVGPNAARVWWLNNGETNPLGDQVTATAKFVHGGTTTTTMTLAMTFNS